MTLAAPGGTGPPPPITQPPPSVGMRPLAIRLAIDRVYASAVIMKVLFVMNVAVHLIAALVVAGAIIDENGPRSAQDVLASVGFLVMWLVLAAVNGAGIYGTYQMEALRRRPWAILAVVAMLLPCTSPCCVASFPVGIWALIALRRVPYDEWE